MRITETHRATTGHHARLQLRRLEANPRTRVEDLGRGRDLLNQIHHLTQSEDIASALTDLDALIKEVDATTTSNS